MSLPNNFLVIPIIFSESAFFTALWSFPTVANRHSPEKHFPPVFSQVPKQQSVGGREEVCTTMSNNIFEIELASASTYFLKQK